MNRKLGLGVLFVSLFLISLPVTSHADTYPDPLHGCIIGTTCVDNGTVTPTTVNPLPTFTFTVSPGPNTGDFLVDVLVPNNEDPTPGSVSFTISGTSAGPIDTGSVSGSSTLMGLWTGGDLGSWLGLTSSPANPIDAWLAYTQGNNCGATQSLACDPGATGYDVYQVNLGNNELQPPSNPTFPDLTLSGSALPSASLLVGFLGNGSTWIATAPSGAIFEAGGGTPPPTPPPTVPEPTSVILLGTGLLAMIVMLSCKKQLA